MVARGRLVRCYILLSGSDNGYLDAANRKPGCAGPSLFRMAERDIDYRWGYCATPQLGIG